MRFRTGIKLVVMLGAMVNTSAAPAATNAARPEMIVTDQHRQYWSFLPLTNPPLPKVRNMDSVRTPVDRFILARLEEQKQEDGDHRSGLPHPADCHQSVHGKCRVHSMFMDLPCVRSRKPGRG